MFEKKFQLSRNKHITTGISLVSEIPNLDIEDDNDCERTLDALLSINTAFIIRSPTDSVTIKFISSMKRFYRSIKDIVSGLSSNIDLNDNITVSIDDNKDVLIKQNDNEVTFSEFETNRFIIIFPFLMERLHKLHTDRMYTFVCGCIIENGDELLKDPIGAIDSLYEDSFMRVVMIELYLNFYDFLKFMVKISKRRNFTVVDE